MAKNSFRIIGIKAVWPQPEEFPVADARYYDKVESIQKALYGTDRWYYFYKGITIGDDYQKITMTPQAKQDYSLFDTNEMKISLCTKTSLYDV